MSEKLNPYDEAWFRHRACECGPRPCWGNQHKAHSDCPKWVAARAVELVASLRDELEVSEAANKAKTLMLADSAGMLTTQSKEPNVRSASPPYPQHITEDDAP